MKNVGKNCLFIIILVALSLLPFIWLRSGLIYMSEEDNFGNFKNVLYRNVYSWSPSVNKGNPVLSNDHIVIIPAGITYQIFSKLGISNNVTQKVYLSAIIFITLISIIYALQLFTSDKMILLAGALFYYLNFYTKSTTFYSAKMYQLILMPLFFAFLFNYLKTKKYMYVSLNFLVFFLFQAIFTNLATFAATIIFYPIAILYHFVKQKESLSIYSKKHLTGIIIFFLPIIPIFFYNGLLYYFSYVSNNTYEAIKQSHTFTAISASLNYIFQLRGAWWETAGFEGVSYNPWLWFYNNPIIILCSFFLIAFIFSYNVYKKKIPRAYSFWFLISTTALLFASGASFYQPLYKWFLLNVPLFYIFREPWAKFMPIILFSGAILLVLNLRDFKNKYIIYGVIVLILIRGIPFFSPDFFDYHSKRGYMPFAKLPSYWNEYEQWTRSHQDVTVMSIPIDYFMRNWYHEDLGNINHPLTRLFGYANTIFENNSNNFGLLLHYFIEHQNPTFIKVAHIDTALLQNDVDMQRYPPQSKAFSDLLRKYFENSPYTNFGNKLFLYEIKPAYISPIIFIPNKLMTIGGMSSFANILAQDTYALDTGVFLKSQNRDKMYLLNDDIARYQEKTSKTSVTFSKVNPTQYIVTLQNIDRITPLVFYQNYHPDWKIYPTQIDQSPATQFTHYFFPPNISPDHFTANGYANAWFIDPDTFCKEYHSCVRNADGSYTIKLVVEYWPNRLFTLGLVLFGITSIVLLLRALLTPFKKNI